MRINLELKPCRQHWPSFPSVTLWGWALILLASAEWGCIRNSRVVGHESLGLVNTGHRGHPGRGQRRLDSGLDLGQATADVLSAQAANGVKDREPRPKEAATNSSVLENQDPEIERLIQKLSEGTSRPEVLFQLGSAYHRYHVFDKAERYYRETLAEDSENTACLEALGRLYREWGRFESGVEVLMRALQLRPDFAAAWNSLGTVYDRLGRLDDAERCYTEALKIDDTLGFVHNNLCYHWLRRGDALRAIAHGRRAVEENPEMNSAHNNLGLAYALDGRLQEAFSEFRESGDEAAAHYNLGLVHMSRQAYLKAMEHFRQAAKLRPFYLAASRAYQKARNAQFARVREIRQQMRIWSQRGESGFEVPVPAGVGSLSLTVLTDWVGLIAALERTRA
ncbi:MAG: tetratricopeptide repeat protein [Acidobacteriota bacterium]